MSLTNQTHKGIDAGNKSSGKIFKGIFYSRKNKIQGKDNSPLCNNAMNLI